MSLLQGDGTICPEKNGQPVPTAHGAKQKPQHKAARSPPSLDFVYRGQPFCGKMCSRQPPGAALRRLSPPLLNFAWKKHRAVRNGWHPENVLGLSTVSSSINRPHVLVREESGTTLRGAHKGHSQGNWEAAQVHTLCLSASSPASYGPGLTSAAWLWRSRIGGLAFCSRMWCSVPLHWFSGADREQRRRHFLF